MSDDIYTPVLTAHRAGLVGCRECGRVWPKDTKKCGRCGSKLHLPDRRGLQKVWAWMLAGMVFYVPANVLPIMRTQTMGGLRGDYNSTVMGGVITLIEHHSYDIALVVFLASIVVPISKFVAITWLAVVAGKPSSFEKAHTRLRVYEFIEFIGRWSMIDVFVVASLSALVQLGFVVSIHPGVAAASFALSVALTMIAAQSFDPRLIWRGLPLRTRTE